MSKIQAKVEMKDVGGQLVSKGSNFIEFKPDDFAPFKDYILERYHRKGTFRIYLNLRKDLLEILEPGQILNINLDIVKKDDKYWFNLTKIDPPIENLEAVPGGEFISDLKGHERVDVEEIKATPFSGTKMPPTSFISTLA